MFQPPKARTLLENGETCREATFAAWRVCFIELQALHLPFRPPLSSRGMQTGALQTVQSWQQEWLCAC
jgi:hypothetical protein